MPTTGTDMPPIRSLAELPGLAAQQLDAAVLAWLDGGAGEEHTLCANHAAWQALSLWPRALQPLAGGNTRTTLAGHEMAHPVWLAPVAMQKLAHPDGELASARAAAAQGAGFILSTHASTPVEKVAEAMLSQAGRGPLWFQLYWQPDRQHNLALVERAAVAGCEAIVLTVDAPVQGPRDREALAGFRMPSDMRAVHLDDLPPLQARKDTYCGGLPAHAPSWKDVAWLCERSALPLWLKGIVHPLDARQAADSDVAGLIVSNHGGRTLDGMPATATALPRVRQAVGPDMPLMVDGGIRRGVDVLKALALGADAVLVGRPMMHALACGGAMGVARMLRLLRDELEIAMALSGCRERADIGPKLLASG